MKKTDWNNINKSAKAVKKNVKNTKIVGDLLSRPLNMYVMRDYSTQTVVDENGNKTKVKKVIDVDIRYCKNSTLRRFIKTLDNAYYLMTNEKDKKMILDKKIEIENELSLRPDALTK